MKFVWLIDDMIVNEDEFFFFFFLGRDQYMSYQKKRVGEVDDDRLKFELSTILSREVILQLYSFIFTW